MVVSINSSNFDNEIKFSSKPVLIEVYATWCGPCQHMMPIVEELANELGHQYKFAKLNVDEAREIAVAFGITSVPSFLFISKFDEEINKNKAIEERVISKEIGYMTKEALASKMEKFLK